MSLRELTNECISDLARVWRLAWHGLSLYTRDAGLCCGSRLRMREVFAYVGLIHNLKDLKGSHDCLDG